MINLDCMEYMAGLPDKAFELAIVDPPYGIGAGGNGFINSGNKYNREIYRENDWDNAIPSQHYFTELRRISANQIIWGGNYFELPPTRCFLIWDKVVPHDFSYAMCELAWASFDMNAKIFRETNKKDIISRIPPTQKPVKLYEWLLTNYAKKGDRILDTHGGSGSSAIACHNLGFDMVWMELDKDYYDAACKRFNAHIAQARMFGDGYEQTEVAEFEQRDLL